MSQSQRTVLVIDDSPEDRELYRRCLLRDEEYHYTILEAQLGWEGLELWQRHQPDAVLLDYRLPDSDGLEWLAQIQNQTQQPCLPIILVTGKGNETIAVQAMKAGAQDYLIKEQITPESLRLVVNRAIETVQLRTQTELALQLAFTQLEQRAAALAESNEKLQTVVEELEVAQEELRTQNEELAIANSNAERHRQRYLDLFDFAPDAYLVTNEQGLIQEANQAAVALLRLELDQLIGKPLNLFIPEQEYRFSNQLYNLRQKGASTSHRPCSRRELTLQTPGAKPIPVEVSVATGLAGEGEGKSRYWLIRDISDRQQVENALRESQHFIQQIAETIPGILYVYDLIEQRNIYVNQQVTKLLGYTAEQVQMMGADLLPTLIHPEDFARVPAHIAQFQTAQNGEIFELEYRMQLANGEWRWFFGREVVFSRTADGLPQRILGIVQDITKLKQTAAALLSTMERFEQAAAAVNCLIYEWDLQHGTVERTRGLTELVGYTLEEAEPTVEWWGHLIHPDDFALFDVDEFWARIQMADRFGTEYRVQHKHGHHLWVQDHQIVVRNAEGQAVKIVGSTTDITNRKQAEAALVKTNSILQAVINGTNDVIFVKDLQGRYVFANQAAARWLNTTVEAMLGQDDMALFPADVAQSIQAVDRQVIHSGEFVTNEEQLLKHDDLRSLLSKKYPWRNEQGEIIGIIGISIDITDRKQAEIERERLLEREQAARAEAERANRVKDEFLAILSHELRSPLNPILGWTKLLQIRKFDEAKTREALATIERNVKLQTQLIDDLLDVARILRGKLALNAAPIDLVFIIESAIETVRTAAVAKSILIHPVLPRIGQVSGDPTRLQQIVWNLLSNAIKFTPNGGQVSIHLERIDDQAQIRVIDNGIGISPDFLPHIFEYFRQEDASITRKHGGLGLGLAIVHNLVEAHGGTISAASPGVGQGATFTVRLPLLSVERMSDRTDDSLSGELDLTGIRVLLVDDEPDTRELLAFMLLEYGAEAMAVASAGEVLALLESFKPDILISDIGMPAMDGYTLLRQVRSLPPERGGLIPAIAITAYARVEDEQQAISAGFQGHISKPVAPGRLIAAISDLLGDGVMG